MIRSELYGRRVMLRPLVSGDFEEWRDIRTRNVEWLTKWEPRQPEGYPNDSQDRVAFGARCGAREREWQLGTGYGFGIFVAGRFVGEMNLSGVQRGPFQNAYVGYWIDEGHAGNGYVPEALVVAAQFAFEGVGLHRLQVAIIPRNKASRRVAEKLALRDEGIAVRYLAIYGVWEDHIRYAITQEEWVARRGELLQTWVEREPLPRRRGRPV